MSFGDRFLTDPTQFPSSTNGTPWGNERLIVDFVGGPYLITGLSLSQAELLRDHFEESCTTATTEQMGRVHIQICQDSDKSFKDISKTPREITFDLDHQKNHLNISGLYVMARLDFQPALSATLWTCKNDDSLFSGIIFENIFRMVVTYRLHEDNGMLIHSGAVVDDGEAVLFPGRSNDGKSTLSKLSLQTGRTVLSDDMNALTWENGVPILEKVPFAGDLGRTWTRSSQYPLKGIFAISKTAETILEPMAAPQAVALLVASTPYLNTDSMRMADLLANLHQLAMTVPTGRLGFTKNEDFWPEIQQYLKQ